MAKRKLPKEVPPVKGDPDFAGVARERVQGPADYDESAGNELQPDRSDLINERERKETEEVEER